MNKLFARSIAVSAVLFSTCLNLSLPQKVYAEPNSSEVGGGLVYVPPSSESRTRQLYKSILGREPDPSGLRDNVNAMNKHGFKWVRAGMAGSQESRKNINNFYRRYLCRNADPGGMEHHINLLASGQMALDQLRNGIANGAEAQQHANGCRWN